MATIAEMLKLATAHHRAGRLAEAEQLYRQVLTIDPANVDATHLFGVLAGQVGNSEVAIDYIGRAIRADANRPAFQVNLADVLRNAGRFDEAIAAAQRALALAPGDPEAHNMLGTAYQAKGLRDEALASYGRALELDPRSAKAHSNLGPLLADEGRLDEALAHFDAAIAAQPSLAEAHANRGVARLLLGDFAAGWPDFEWRLKLSGAPRRTWTAPLWDGSPLEGRTILLWNDGALGDALQFIRYAPRVKARSGRVVVACRRRMMPILGTCAGIDALVDVDEPLPPHDAHAPLLSLPSIFKTDLASVPADVPYLRADDDAVARWRRRLSDDRRLRVGIHWQGNPQYPRDASRSFHVREFAPVAALTKVRLVSLQQGLGVEQLADAPFAVEDVGSRIDESQAAFRETAAIVKNLDLVITSDTALAHLAGALGVRVWVALALVPDWRWMLARPDSPWYPTMRLFRQDRPADWSSAFAAMVAELSALSCSASS